MKALFFLIVLAAVVSIVIWRVRKSDAEARLAQAEALELRKKLRNEAVTTKDPVQWPTIIRTVSGDQSSESETPEPMMATIEYEPAEHANLQH